MEALPHTSPLVHSITNCSRHLSYTEYAHKDKKNVKKSSYFLLLKVFIVHHTLSVAAPFLFVNTYFVEDWEEEKNI